MAKSKKSEVAKDKPAYNKPVFEKTEGLTFPEEIIQTFNGIRCCLQCSSCHGCS